jgi:hypothetical protein
LKKLQIAVACLALAGAALAQTDSSGPKLEQRPTPPATAAANETPNVAPDAAVITIDGLCEKPANSSAMPADCKTVVTRADFEKLIDAVQPNLPQTARKQIAQRYAMMLYLAEKAHQAGLDQGPAFDEKLSIARLQLLAQLGGAHAHEDAAKVTDGEIANYYQEHAADYETISFDRLRIPKQKQPKTAAPKTGAPAVGQKPDSEEGAMKAEADKLRARAAAGEDFAKLQQEAYDFAGYSQIKSGDPRVNQARRPTVPPADQSIFDLKKGDVSQVFDDGGEFVVYKIEAVEAMPLAGVRDEISRKLASEREKAMMDNLQKSTKLDDAYFATPTPAAPPTLRNPGEAIPAAPPAPGKK